MATTVARLEAKLTADTRDFDKAMDKSHSTMGKLVGIAGKAGVAGALVGIGVAAKIGIQEFADSQKITAQTNAVLKSTGGIANVSAAQIDKLSGSLLKKSGIDDEAIKSGENMLLTFTNIRNEVGKGNDIFNQTTKTLVDMSVATGQDMTHASVMLGKAINDPVKGIGALSRVGVTFTEAQKKSIKAMVASGDTMGAQKVILHELNKEFGGSAEALGKTLPGQINIAKETFNNWMGELVAKTIPILQQVIGWLRDHWPEIQDAIGRARAAIAPIIQNLADLFVEIVNVIRDNWDTIGPIVRGVVKVLEDAAVVVAYVVKLITDLLKGDWSAAWKDAKKIVTTQIDLIKTELTTAATALLTIATKLGKAILDGIVAGITGVTGQVWDIINNIGSFIVSKIEAVKAWGENVGNWIKNAVVNSILGVGNAAWDVINNIGSAIAAKIETIKGWGTSIGTWLKNAIVDAIGSVTGVLSAALSFGKGIASSILKGLEGLGSGLLHAIIDPINGIIDKLNAIHIPIPKVHIPLVGTFGGGSIDFNIPKLAAGAIVKEPTLAMIGEKGPEAVVPLPKFAAAGGIAAASGPIEVSLILDGNKLAEVLIDPLRRKAQIFQQRNGRPAF